jgi:predicted anti-sigma-YlaC factor YlaD
MVTNHLNDEQIQMYLDKTAHQNSSQIEAHLSSCAQCREKYLLYKDIYYELTQDKFPALSTEFSRNIMNHLAGKSRRSLFQNEFFLSGLAIFIAITGMLLWIQPWDLLQRFFLGVGEQTGLFINSLKHLFGGRFTLIALIFLVLIIIEIIDYKFIRPRLKHLFHNG